MRATFLSALLAPALVFAQNAPNPDCANAYPIAVSPGSVPDPWVLSNSYGEPNAITPAACTGNGYNDVWFSFVATASALNVVHDANGTVIEAFSGSCGALNSIGCTAGAVATGALPLTGLVVGNTYYFRSYGTAAGGVNGGGTRRWGVVHPITNDECAGATEIVPSPHTGTLNLGVQLSTIGATQSQPGCWTVAASDDDVWLRFTATAAKHLLVIAPESAIEVQAFSGTCGSLTSLWCEDDWLGDREITGLTPGQEVFLRVYSDYATPGTFVWFRAGILSPPLNDECANAITMVVNESAEPGQQYGFDQEGATSSVVNDYTALRDVWFQFTAPASPIVVEKIGSFNLALFEPNCVDGIMNQTGPTPLILDALTPGTSYKLKASGFNGAIRTRGLTTNDDCADAISLSVQPEGAPLDYTHAVTYGATESSTACTPGTDDDVWFTFTATAPSVRMRALADGTPLRYELSTGTCGALTVVECAGVDLNFGTALDSLVIGTSYTFRLWTNQAVQKPIRVALSVAASNDECAGALPLVPTTLADYDVDQRTEFRFATSSMPQCGSASTALDLWYSFTASASTAALLVQAVTGTQEVNTELFSGTCASLTSLLCTDELQTNYTGLVPGETYFVRVYPVGVSASARFRHQFYAPPVNDDMAGAIQLFLSGDAFAHPMVPYANYGASSSFAQAACTGTPADDVWFYFVATTSEHHVGLDIGSLNYEENAPTMRIETFRGFSTIPDTLLANELVCGTSVNGIDVTGLSPGDTVMVRFFNSTVSVHNIRTFHPYVSDGGTADEASGAVPITAYDVYAGAFDTNNATESLPSNGCAVIGDSPDDDIWFKFVHDGEAATVMCHFIDNNAVLELFQGPVGSLTSISCGYNYLVLPNGMVDGQTYHLRVYSRNTSDLEGKLGIFHTPHPMESECADVECLGPNLVLNPGIEPGALNATQFQSSGSPDPIGQGLAPDWHAAIATADNYSAGVSYNDDKRIPQGYASAPDAASDPRPRGGGGVAGAFASDGNDYYEAIGGRLSAPMVPGLPYLIAFNVRVRSEQASCDGFGAHLSMAPISIPSPYLNVPMHIEWTGGPIGGSDEWQTICGQFIADQPYEHITIGALKPADELDCTGGIAYYYFDDVTVAEIIDALCVTVDVEEVDSGTSAAGGGDGLHVFPNPANDRVSIAIEDALVGQRAVIELFDATGKRVHARQVSSLGANAVVELPASLHEGLYLVMLRVEGRAVRSARLVVSR